MRHEQHQHARGGHQPGHESAARRVVATDEEMHRDRQHEGQQERGEQAQHQRMQVGGPSRGGSTGARERDPIEQRMQQFRLREDRADVIVPALQVYMNAMRWADAEEIYVPKIGLADGLIHTLYDEVGEKKSVTS